MSPCISSGWAAKFIALPHYVNACYIGANVIPTDSRQQALRNCQLKDAQPVNKVRSQGFITCHKARSIMLLHHSWTKLYSTLVSCCPLAIVLIGKTWELPAATQHCTYRQLYIATAVNVVATTCQVTPQKTVCLMSTQLGIQLNYSSSSAKGCVHRAASANLLEVQSHCQLLLIGLTVRLNCRMANLWMMYFQKSLIQAQQTTLPSNRPVCTMYTESFPSATMIPAQAPLTITQIGPMWRSVPRQ